MWDNVGVQMTSTASDSARSGVPRLLSAFTIFLGSFLSFGVQPMVGRTLLPAFGGTAAVWVVCLCAFQALLLAGYWVAHTMAGRYPAGLSRSRAFRIYLLLLVASAVWTVFVSLRGRAVLAPAVGGALPALQVLACVAVLVGVPYVLLSANASLVQALAGGEYRLYAVSNIGSLVGLLAYPFVFEPFVGLTAQWIGFAGGIVAYAGLLWLCGLLEGDKDRREEDNRKKEECVKEEVCTRDGWWLWLGLPAASCFLLNALTTHVTLDIMPMPLVWTGSLALFLLSYVVGFSGRGERLVCPFAWTTLVMFVFVCWVNGCDVRHLSPFAAAGACGVLLFVACSFLHAWLYSCRPGASGLTRYYLLQAVGGATGGMAASLVFPLSCRTVMEYPVALFGVAALAALAAVCRGDSRSPRRGVLAVGFRTAPALLAMVAGIWIHLAGAQRETRPVVYRGRGFFGTIEVLEAKARTASGEGCVREFVHGTTIHGIQAHLPGKARMPTTYYTPDASGYAICGHPKYRTGEPMRVNVTGLGVGVLFCYGRTNDYYRAYEISQDALRVAMDTNLFTFVSDCPARKEIVLGDARKGLEAELAAGVEPYDVIVVDAFTGDNLPYHLSTREAFELYFRLLKPDGVLCVNISNWHLTLEPFMRAVGDAFEVPVMGLETRDDFARLAFGAKVAFFCRKPDGMAPPPVDGGRARMIDFGRWQPMARLPTDEKGSFIGLVKWSRR